MIVYFIVALVTGIFMWILLLRNSSFTNGDILFISILSGLIWFITLPVVLGYYLRVLFCLMYGTIKFFRRIIDFIVDTYNKTCNKIKGPKDEDKI